MTQIAVVEDLVDDAYDVVKALNLGVVDSYLSVLLEILEVVVKDGEDVYIKNMVFLYC